ncbi:MAG TPA: STAS domain-containing protein [Bacillota bacterium]
MRLSQDDAAGIGAHLPDVAILRLEDFLIVSIQSDLTDRTATALQARLLDELSRTRARGICIDFSGVDVVDSFLGRLIRDMAAMARLMGARTVVVGLRPAVAVTLVELGLDLPGVHTDLNLERGLAWLRRSPRPTA